MRDAFRGWYKPLPEERDCLWHEGLIALDASALLAPYRVSVEIQRLFFDALEANSSRLWCPYQAAKEYQENRLRVAREQFLEYDAIEKKLDSAEVSLLQRRSDHPVIDSAAFEAHVKRALGSIRRFIKEIADTHPVILDEDPDRDVIRDRWDMLLNDGIGERLDLDDQWRKRADERYAAEIPPGFKDQKKEKPGRKYGDLIIWSELLARVKSQSERVGDSVAVLFITEDKKSDWWREIEGERHGPDPRLVEEIGKAGGVPFWMHTVESYVHEAAMRFEWEISSGQRVPSVSLRGAEGLLGPASSEAVENEVFPQADN